MTDSNRSDSTLTTCPVFGGNYSEASEVIDIKLGGETITATAEHPLWVEGEGWVAAANLVRGSPLRTKDGRVVRVESVKRREGEFKVYNFEVELAHTYYVSSAGILVHNQCGTGGNRPVHSIYEDGTLVYEGNQPPRIKGPLSDASGEHTVLRYDEANKRVYQGREYDSDGRPIRDIDFTSPTYPNGRPRPDHLPPPHVHPWIPVDPANPKAGFRRSRTPHPLY